MIRNDPFSICFSYILCMATKTVVVRLDDEDYELLRQRARALGVRPGTAARILLRADLAGPNSGHEAEERKRKALDALDRLREIASRSPRLSAVDLVREGREELEDRLTETLGWPRQ
jgi:hypothetical protein